jgi:hypothetical protein
MVAQGEVRAADATLGNGEVISLFRHSPPAKANDEKGFELEHRPETNSLEILGVIFKSHHQVAEMEQPRKEPLHFLMPQVLTQPPSGAGFYWLVFTGPPIPEFSLSLASSFKTMNIGIYILNGAGT